MSVPLEMPSSQMDVEAFSNSDSDKDNLANVASSSSSIATESLSTTTTTAAVAEADQIALIASATDKMLVGDADDNDKSEVINLINNDKKDSMENSMGTAIAITTAQPSAAITIADKTEDAANKIILVKNDVEAVVSTSPPNQNNDDEKIDAESNEKLAVAAAPATSEIVNIYVKGVTNEKEVDNNVVETKTNLDEPQFNEPSQQEITPSPPVESGGDINAIIEVRKECLLIEDDKSEKQQTSAKDEIAKQEMSQEVDSDAATIAAVTSNDVSSSSSSVVDNKGTVELVVKIEDEMEESDNKIVDSSLEIIENLDDTDKSDEKMDEDDDDDDGEVVEDVDDVKIGELMDEDDDDMEEEEFEEEPENIDEEEEEAIENEVDDEQVEEQSSGNAILIDDDDDEDDEDEDDDDVDDEDDDDVDEDEDVEEEEEQERDHRNWREADNDDDDIEEVIASDDEDVNSEQIDDSEAEEEEIQSKSKPNMKKGVDKRFGPKFKSKIKRPHNYFAYLKKRSIKWLTKKMHVMESDEMISTIPNDLTAPTVGSGKNKENDYRYNSIKDDEGIELIEDKDDHHHHSHHHNQDIDDETVEEDDDDEDDDMESSHKIDSSSDNNVTVKKLNKTDSNIEKSIIKNVILKQNDNNNISSNTNSLSRSKSKTPPKLSSATTSETLDLSSSQQQQQQHQSTTIGAALSSELKTNKEFKNDSNLVKKNIATVVQEDNNNSNTNINNNNNNKNSCSDKKIKNDENVKIINLSNDDIEMIEDNQAVDLSQEKQPEQTQPIELKILDKDNNNEKDNEIVLTNQKVKSPNNSNVDCDKKVEIKKEEKPYVEPKPQDQQLLKSTSTSSSSSAAATTLSISTKENSLRDKKSNENNKTDDSGDEIKKFNDNSGGGRSPQSGAIKRSSSPSANNQSLDYSNPSKKHCDETNSAAANLDQTLATTTTNTNNSTTNNNNNNLLNEIMEKSQNDTPDELKKHIDQIQEEIQSLDEMLKIKEQEWNNMLHLKKMKEEIFERLTRRKRINDIKSILSIGSMDNYNAMIVNSLKPNNKISQSGESGQQSQQQQPSMAVSTLKDFTSKFSNAGTNNALAAHIRTSATQTILQNRANIKASELVKEKLNSQRVQRTILPKTTTLASSILQSTGGNNQNKILNYTSTNLNQQKKQSIHQQQQQDYLNGHQSTQSSSSSSSTMGRQGAIKDVQSIIADYRQKHPEEVPRRGRRLRPSFSINEMSGGEGGRDGNSRPSSADSSHSNSNLTSTPITASSNNAAGAASNISFKDVLVKYAKMTPSERQRLNTGNSATLLSSLNLSNSVSNKAYPEVTLHPLNTTSSNSSALHSAEQNTNLNTSLLHGILTKNTTRPIQIYNSFSPTLARLLTAPERITPQTSAHYHQNSSNSNAGRGGSGGGGGGSGDGAVSGANASISSLTNPGVNLTKNHNEITITPVMHSNSTGTGSTFLKRETGSEYSGSGNRIKTESNSNLDDEADDSADRLVIDEGDSPGDQQNMSGTGQEFHENEVPECQGCKKREAQFVCAGCGNQWYCSRECQVRAWDEHSDICTG